MPFGMDRRENRDIDIACRAFKQLGQKFIPVRIIEASDASSAALALIENLQREGLNAIEEAQGYASLIRDFDLTQETAAVLLEVVPEVNALHLQEALTALLSHHDALRLRPHPYEFALYYDI